MQINFKDITYKYNENTPYENTTLKNININIEEGSFTVIIGKTGSGKSTLIEHINGLLIPTKGYVDIGGLISEKKKSKRDKKILETNLIKKREKISILFQFSEQQLFAETVLEDIIYAPLNYGVTREDAVENAKNLIKLVELNEDYLNKSPFELSGGEKRKVALCGVLAVEPDVLVLDEPTIALDYKSKLEFIELIKKIYKKQNITIVLVTHNMEYALDLATNIIILDSGKTVFNSGDKDEFIDILLQNKYNLVAPEIVLLQEKLKKEGIEFSKLHTDYDEFLEELSQKIGDINE